MFNNAKKIEQWKRAGPLSCYPLCSHEFESHGRHSYKVFTHLNFGVVFFHVFFFFIICVYPFLFDFSLCFFFVLYFLVVLFFVVVFC